MSGDLSCWEDGTQFDEYGCSIDGTHSTCLLPDGHDGPHDFTPDSDIIIQLVDPPEATQ